MPGLRIGEFRTGFERAHVAADEFCGAGLREQEAAYAGRAVAGLSSSQKKRNRKNSGIRARVEHLFRIVKRQFGYTKVRYRGLAKNAAQVMTLIGLANLYSLRGRLAAA